MKMVIDGGSTMKVDAEAAIKRCYLKAKPYPHPFKVAWSTRPTSQLPIDVRFRVRLVAGTTSYVMSSPGMSLTFS